VSGTVSATNSLVGSTAGDLVGSKGVTALSNGNYVVDSPSWSNGTGAATWGSGTTGVSGAVSASNSLVGSTFSDQIGFGGATALSDGNYVVNSPFWSNGTGAATWGSGTTGISGAVSATNSLVGSTTGDLVGSKGVTALSNGNYVVDSPSWSNGSLANAGAVTLGSGTTGVSGAVSATNSTVGATANTGLQPGVVVDNVNDAYYSRFLTEGGGHVRVGSQSSILTPVFSVPTTMIVYGTPTTTLSGTLASGTSYPTGSTVSITLNSVTRTATVDATGHFTTTFDTSSLGAAGSPYTVTYAFAGNTNFSAVTDTSTALTVTKATPVITGQTAGVFLILGTPTTSLGGSIGSASVQPTGSVSIQLTGAATGTVLNASATINATTGAFLVSVSTADLPADWYTITYSYAGDPNFKAAAPVNGVLTVQYAVTLQTDPTRAKNGGATLPIMLQVDDAAGQDVGSSALAVTAVGISGAGDSGPTMPATAPGNSSPGGTFSFDGATYQFNLKLVDSTGAALKPGSYQFYYQVGSDPTLHVLTFLVA
jgi:hypothetical protein